MDIPAKRSGDKTASKICSLSDRSLKTFPVWSGCLLGVPKYHGTFPWYLDSLGNHFGYLLRISHGYARNSGYDYSPWFSECMFVSNPCLGSHTGVITL